MSWDTETLSYVYDKTNGYCRYCGKKLAWSHHGMPGERGAWEVDHSVPLARGGTNQPRNLWASCVECNTDKGTLTGAEYNRMVRSVHEDRMTLADVIAGLLVIGAAAALLQAFSRSNR